MGFWSDLFSDRLKKEDAHRTFEWNNGYVFECNDCKVIITSMTLPYTFASPQPIPACGECGSVNLTRLNKDRDAKYNKSSDINNNFKHNNCTHDLEYYESFGAQKRRCRLCHAVDFDYYIPNYYKK